MPDLLMHFAIPFTLATPILGIKTAIILGIIATLPDLDALLHIHRSASHSIPILSIITIPVLIAIAKKKPNLTGTTIAAILSLISHPILDAFQTYAPILYPLTQTSIYINIEGGIIIGQTLAPHLKINIQTTPTNFKPFTQLDAPIFTSQTLPISLTLILTPIIYNLLIKPKLSKTNLATTTPTVSTSQQTVMLDPLIHDDPTPITPNELTIIIPTLNEAEAIGKVIDELHQHGYHNILVVDGNSTDGTPQIAQSKGAKVIQQKGKGKADAIKTAINYVNTPYLLIMDGDYTYNPAYIKELLKHAKENDEVIGARTIGRKNIPLINRLGNWIITKAFNLLFGTKLKDVCSGMYLLRTEIAKEINYEAKGFSLEVEVAAHVASTTRKIKDIPIHYRPRIGKPKLKTWDGLSIITDAIQLAWRYNPAFFIFASGTLLLIPSTAILAWVAYRYFIYGAKHYVWAILGAGGTGIGIISLLLAIITLYIKRIEYRILEKLRKLNQNQT